MGNGLRDAADRRLAGLAWTDDKTQSVLARARRAERAQTKARPRIKLALAVSVALLLLAATALALTLRYSAGYGARAQARGALAAKYGLTDEMLDLFGEDWQHEDGGWTVAFTPYSMNLRAIGEYAVTKDADGALHASWTHDGKPNPGGLTSPVWNAEQIAEGIALRREHSAGYDEIDWESEDLLAELAARDEKLLATGEVMAILHVAPTTDELSEPQARDAAMRALVEKYGVSLRTLAGMRAECGFYQYMDTGYREYRVHFSDDANWYSVYLSGMGEVAMTFWQTDVVAAPPFDVATHPEAAKEYMASGVFEKLSAADKASVARALEDAGLPLLVPGKYAAPGADDLPETEAAALARAALLGKFGLTDDDLGMFEERRALTDDGGRAWCVTFVEPERYGWRHEGRLGDYTVTLSAKDGRALACDWTLAGVEDGAFTQRTFGKAQAYAAYILPWVRALEDAQAAILAKYPEDINTGWLSLEDDAAYDALLWDAGFELPYRYVLPAPEELSKEEAIALAKELLYAERGVSADTLDDEIFVNCYARLDEETRWSVRFGSLTNGDEYTVILFAEDGALDQIVVDTPASANG